MNRYLGVSTACVLLLLSGSSRAGIPEETCDQLREARGFLVTMLEANDRSAIDDLKGRVYSASARVDQNVNAMRNGPDAARAAEFQKVWEQFKSTRESEIIPAVYAGRQDHAKSVATGVQAERMKAMRATLGCK